MFQVFACFVCIFVATTVATCPSGNVVEYQSDCYIFSSNATQFPIAELACTSMSGHLASIHDAFANALISSEASNFFHSDRFWIGLNTLIVPDGKWSWTDGSPVNFQDWAVSEPKNLSNCVTVNQSQWFVTDCMEPHSYVCKVPSGGGQPSTMAMTSLPTTKSPPTVMSSQPPVSQNCSNGWMYFEATGSCYGLMKTTQIQWLDAENNCKSSNAHLVSIHSAEEAAFVSNYANGPNQELWIGLYSDDAEVSWKWTDGSPLDYLPWCDDYPFLSTEYNSTCAYIAENKFWDYMNEGPFFYMCKKPQQSFMTPTPQPQVSSTPSIKTNCSENWVYFEATHSCYGLMLTNPANWTFAEGDCQTHGANLASIHSSAEADFVSNNLATTLNDETWIGLYSRNNQRTWYWTDGSPVDYLPWGDEEVYNRASISKSKFHHTFFRHQLNYLCKKPAQKTIY